MRAVLLGVGLAASFGLALPAAWAQSPAGPGPFAGQLSDVYGMQPTDPVFHGGRPAPAPFSSAQDQYRRELLALRAEALRVRAQDGGTLSAAHQQALQHKLDRLNSRYGVKRP